jgi:glycosyltransferase involved in cell wall biosynthesis
MGSMVALCLFWGALGLIIYTYIGFPILILLRAVLTPKPIRRGAYLPKVSMIIAAYNEAAVIQDKLHNTFSLDYPQTHLEVIVASDGSDDGTNELVLQSAASQVRLLALPRQGKNPTLNTAVSLAQGDILLFCDADSMLAPDALRRLMEPFHDPEVGGVGGDYRYTSQRGGSAGERAYWSFDRILKSLQSRAGSMTSVSGAIYAIRRSLYQPLPVGVTDDFYIAMQAPSAHLRLVFEPRAVAYGPIAASAKAEFRRKVRVITAGLRGVWRMQHLLNPMEYGFDALQLLSHKVLRRLMILPLIILGITAPILWSHGWFYQLAAFSQFALHGTAIIGFLLQPTPLSRLKVFSVPFYFDMVNIAALVAIANLRQGKRHDLWLPQRLAQPDGDIPY